ncbi:hypothetical protein H072_8302 [Dactylellina haptotyla CBS 200.50]|uniref:Pectate lyase domain-containing protein n=1 Tax=Dactylellina haptotyla (strain CBS 200.50) TaxID=1284197 RepID=S8A5A5_DACHA|nr:hypothetical protein H072_8302 [Dactylellina haptotyla CBS 200.50]
MYQKEVLLLAFLPAALGCLNPGSNSCASFIKSQSATASAFCATFTKSTVTATTGLPSWATYCSNKPSMISAECSCAYTGGSSNPTTTMVTTTRAVTTTAGATTRTTTTSAVGGGSGGCAAPVNQLVGYGGSATGGGSGSGTTVTSCSALSAAAKNGGVIKVSGLLSGCGVVDLVGGTSLLGVGSGSGIVNGGIRLKDISNVIVRNLKFSPAPKGDAVSLDGATNVWIDHNDFYSLGLVGGKDDYDGLLDITHASNMVTVSWNKFHDHWKGSLIGHSDSNASEDTGKLKVTYHHNSWNNVNSRLPSLRFGTGHMYSSCYNNCPTSGINSRMGAQVLVENCSFNNVPLAIVTDLDSDTAGYAVQRNNIFLGTSTTRITQTGNLSPPYSYTMTSASSVCNCVSGSAGVGVVTF